MPALTVLFRTVTGPPVLCGSTCLIRGQELERASVTVSVTCKPRVTRAQEDKLLRMSRSHAHDRFPS